MRARVLVAVVAALVAMSGAIHSRADTTIDAGALASDCNTLGTVPILDNTTIDGGSGTLTQNCTLDLAPGVQLTFSGATLDGAGFDLIITGALASLVRFEDSEVDMGTGVLLSDGGIDANDSAVEVSGSTLTAATMVLQTGGCGTDGSSARVSKSTLTVSELLVAAAGQEPSPCTPGTNAQVTVKDSTISGGIAVFLTGDASEVVVDKSTLTLTAAPSSTIAALTLFAGNDCEADLENSKMTLTAPSDVIQEQFGDRCDTDLSSNRMTLSSVTDGIHFVDFTGGAAWDLDMVSNKISLDAAASAIQVVTATGGAASNFSIERNQVTVSAGASHTAIAGFVATDDLVASVAQNTITMKAGGSGAQIAGLSAGNNAHVSVVKNTVKMSAAGGLQILGATVGNGSQLVLDSNKIEMKDAGLSIVEFTGGDDTSVEVTKNKITVSSASAGSIALFDLDVGDRGRLSINGNTVKAAAGINLFDVSGGNEASVAMSSNKVGLTGTASLGQISVGAAGSISSQGNTYSATTSGGGSFSVFHMEQTGVGTAAGRITVKDDKISMTAGDFAEIVISGDDTAIVDVQKTTLTASATTSSILIETGGSGSVLVKKSKLSSGDNEITSGTGSSTTAQDNRFTGPTVIHGGGSCVSTGNSPSIACT